MLKHITEIKSRNRLNDILIIIRHYCSKLSENLCVRHSRVLTYRHDIIISIYVMECTMTGNPEYILRRICEPIKYIFVQLGNELSRHILIPELDCILLKIVNGDK